MTVDKESAIRAIVASSVEAFAAGFKSRHTGEHENPNGTLNMKIHNVFIAVLGDEIRYYTALVRSFDSSLGNMLEKMAIEIAKLFYDVRKHVEGPLAPEQTAQIAAFLEAYKSRTRNVSGLDYNELKGHDTSEVITRRHESDYYLVDRETNGHYLIELKIGGDLDNKKARSEKEALMEQFCILSNKLGDDAEIKCFFATAYNRFGEDKLWRQERVLQFFSREELLIGRDFWNFICKSDNGYDIVIDAYKNSAETIKKALANIKRLYLYEE